ncbi:MAG: phosphotransferase [Acidobacteriota bacterium]
MTEGLPPVATEEAYDALPRDDPRFARAAALIALRHGCRDAAIARFGDGSLPVFAVGDDLVLKLYPPHEGEHFRTESAVLDAIAGSLPVPTPRPVATGRYDDWSYVLMERLRGRTLAQCWDRSPTAIAPASPRTWVTRFERCTRSTWRLCPPSTATGARSFTSARPLRGRHRALEASDRWARQIPAFLKGVRISRIPGACCCTPR